MVWIHIHVSCKLCVRLCMSAGCSLAHIVVCAVDMWFTDGRYTIPQLLTAHDSPWNSWIPDVPQLPVLLHAHWCSVLCEVDIHVLSRVYSRKLRVYSGSMGMYLHTIADPNPYRLKLLSWFMASHKSSDFTAATSSLPDSLLHCLLGFLAFSF